MKTTKEPFITMTRQRDDDFYRACCRELGKAYQRGRGYESARALVVATLQHQAPQFYVTHNSALRRLRDRRSKRFKATYKSKQQMWEDLDKRVSDLEARHNIGLSEALMRVLAESRAPQFYVSPSAGEKIFRRRRGKNLITEKL